MFTVVYVLVDDDRLRYYNELMKSLASLRMRMPEQKVCVVMDIETEEILRKHNLKLFESVDVQSVSVAEGYSSKGEISRLLKTTLREIVKGDALYIDTDTVICEPLPDIVTDKSVGMVLEFHSLRSQINWYLTDKWDEQSGLDLGGFDYFFNGGVVFSKDDELAHEFFRKWHDLWEKTRQNGIYRDQTPLNYVSKEMFSCIEILDGSWNVQFCKPLSMGINYLSEAKILHYFNYKGSAYKLCHDEYAKLPYNDPVITEMLKHPKAQFSKSRLVKLGADNNVDPLVMDDIFKISSDDLYEIMLFIREHRFIKAVVVWLWKAYKSIRKGIKKILYITGMKKR